LAAALGLAASEGSAAGLGRLFFAPGERATMELQRHQALSQQASKAGQTINGVVVRTQGKTTVWINGAPMYQGSTLTAFRVDPVDPSRVHLIGAGVVLRVGESRR
jgi:hypothetical protein